MANSPNFDDEAVSDSIVNAYMNYLMSYDTLSMLVPIWRHVDGSECDQVLESAEDN